MKHNNRKHILFVATLPPPVHGSAVVSKQIMDSKIIRESIDCDFVNLSTSRKMDEIGKMSIVKIWRLISSFFQLFIRLIAKRYDSCYISLTCHGGGFLKDAPFALLCKLLGQNLIIHQHNKGMSKDIDRWPYRWLIPLVYKNSKVILLSWRLYPDIEKVVPKENVLICPNGIKVTQKTQNEETNKNLTNITDKSPRLLFLSNLIVSKGVFVLLDALKRLANKGYSFQCVFVGGETKEIDASRFAEEVEKRQLNSFVTYQGRKYGAEKEEAFKESDIFVFPSMEDCFPLVLLEAMEHKLPIVTTNEGAIPDEVVDGENGIICKKNDSKSLAESIRKLLDDAGLQKQMGEKGYSILLDNYTEERFEERMLECLSCF